MNCIIAHTQQQLKKMQKQGVCDESISGANVMLLFTMGEKYNGFIPKLSYTKRGH
ncbi:hypothetical protein ACJX0J_032450, partial [Zea mays]